MAVKIDVSVVSAIAGSPLRSASNRPTSSAAKCCASAADPPLPQTRIRCPSIKAFDRRLPAVSMISSKASRDCMTARCSERVVDHMVGSPFIVKIVGSGQRFLAHCHLRGWRQPCPIRPIPPRLFHGRGRRKPIVMSVCREKQCSGNREKHMGMRPISEARFGGPFRKHHASASSRMAAARSGIRIS